MVDRVLLTLLLCFILQPPQRQRSSAFSPTAAPRTAARERGGTAHTIPRGEGRKERPNGAALPRPSTSSTGELRAQGIESGQQRKQQQQQQEREQEEGFQWRRQWYPVAVMRDLEARDVRQPYPVQLLGEALVVWKDPTNGGWKAFADRCPHRWAPLSEGRVDQKTGNLQCIYHGWEFQGDGKCGNIPQAGPETRDAAQNSKRACATVIPTKILEEKLWLWPDSSPEGMKESERVQPLTVPDLDLESGDFGGNWYARDLAYGADSLMENLADPAHVPFAHHGVIAQRAFGTPMDIEIDDEAATGEDEFVTKKTGYVGNNVMRVGFRAPGLVYYESDYTETLALTVKRLPPPFRALFWAIKKLNFDKKLSMKDEDRKEKGDRLLSYFIGYGVPTSPGKCRIFTRTARNFFLQHPVIPRHFRNSLAKEHVQQHEVLDGDSTALHIQERLLCQAGEQGVQRPEKTFYMPTASDAPIRRFRRWYHSRGGGGPAWAKGVDPSNIGPVLPREEILDRKSHTDDCAACGKAMRVSAAVKRLSAGGGLLLFGAAAAAPRGAASVGLAAGALASAGLAVAMSKRQQRFVFVDYVHAKRDG